MTVHALRTGHRWLSPLITHQSGRLGLKRKAIEEILESESFDVIHYHNISLLGPQSLMLKPRNDEVIKLPKSLSH